LLLTAFLTDTLGQRVASTCFLSIEETESFD